MRLIIRKNEENFVFQHKTLQNNLQEIFYSIHARGIAVSWAKKRVFKENTIHVKLKGVYFKGGGLYQDCLLSYQAILRGKASG